jgi:putative copper export protein
MDVSFAVILLYTLVLGLVAPYISAQSEKYGVLVPPTIALTTGSIIWAVLGTQDGWLWLIIMIAMPLVMVFASARLASARDKAYEAKLAAAKA